MTRRFFFLDIVFKNKIAINNMRVLCLSNDNYVIPTSCLSSIFIFSYILTIKDTATAMKQEKEGLDN